jgi:uncharacterized protein YhfF
MQDGFADWRTLPRFPFGDGPELADELLDLILIGKKRATCWSAAEGVKGTVVGGRWVAEDGQGRPRAVLETIALDQQRFDQVDEDFAAAEGEGDRTLSYWRNAHQDYFTRNGGFTPDMPLCCERFELLAILPIEEEPTAGGQSGDMAAAGLDTFAPVP